MFYKKNSDGYNTPLEGIKLKTLTYGENTHMCEFALEAGSAIPDHSHPHEQIGYMVSGRIDFLIEGVMYNAEPGDSWSIPGDMPHSAKVIEDSVIVEVFSPVREEYL